MYGYIGAALFGLLVAGCLVSIGESLHCWECNSKYDPNCGEPFKNHTISLADCSQRFLRHEPGVSSTICRKITQKVRSETRIIRSCGYLNPEDAGSCITRAGTHLVFMHYCQCAGEGCNHTNGLKPSSSIVILLHLFVSFFAFVSLSS